MSPVFSELSTPHTSLLEALLRAYPKANLSSASTIVIDSVAYDVCNTIRELIPQPHREVVLAYCQSVCLDVSHTAPNRLAYYATSEKLEKDLHDGVTDVANLSRTPIKTRSFLGKMVHALNISIDIEPIAKAVDNILKELSDVTLDVRHFDSSQIEEWGNAYRNNTNVTSCLNNLNYGVTTHNTYRCYCSQAYHLPDNGLTLTALYHGGKYVARAITFTDKHGKKCYVRSYGDDRLRTWLDENDYYKVSGYPRGTILATDLDHDGENYAPYVDGSNTLGSLTAIDGIQAITIGSNGEYNLQETSGSLNGDGDYCYHCEMYHRDDEINEYPDAQGGYELICDDCADDHVRIAYIDNHCGEQVYIRHLNHYYVDDNGIAYDDDGLDHCDLLYLDEEIVYRDDYIYIGEYEDCDSSLGWNNNNLMIDGYVEMGDYCEYGTEIEGYEYYVHDSLVVRDKNGDPRHIDDTTYDKETDTYTAN